MKDAFSVLPLPARLFARLVQLLTAFGLFRFISETVLGKRITGVAAITIKAAFRFRLILALAALLLVTVVGLPLIIKDDGTATGFAQILLTYTLGTIAALMGITTLWLACGTLARDIEECQMQVVATKPISRWQIWAGKWIGIMTLNAILLGFSGLAVYSLILWRAHSGSLRPDEKAKLLNEILVGRISARQDMPDIEPDVKKLMDEKLSDPSIAAMDRGMVRKQVRQMVTARLETVEPANPHRWTINLGSSADYLRDRPMSMRIKFHTAQPTMQTRYNALFIVGPPDRKELKKMVTPMVADSFQEFPLPPNAFDDKGVLTIEFVNPNQMTLLFPTDDGMEVLYKECGFGLNFFRGLCIVFLWLALLAALGLASASYLSFPVAAFLSIGVLVLGLSSGLLSSVVKDDSVMGKSHESGTPVVSPVDLVLVPVFKSILEVIKLAEDFSPIDNLSSGRSVTWLMLGRAVLQIGVFMTGALAAIGMALFQRRELATSQGMQ